MSASLASLLLVSAATLAPPAGFQACWIEDIGAHFRWEASAGDAFRLYFGDRLVAETRYQAQFVTRATVEEILSARVTALQADGTESARSEAPGWFDCGDGIPR